MLKKLLQDKDIEAEFEGFEAEDIVAPDHYYVTSTCTYKVFAVPFSQFRSISHV